VTIATTGVQSQTTTLQSLSPRFEERRHKLYLARILDALANPDVRNVAVAGAYGAGKSSVLQEVTRRLGDRVVSVSLSTLGALPREGSLDDGGLAAGTTTNRIQKEIVKQLLYQADVRATPESRFRRMTPFRWGRNAVSPAIVVAIAAGVAFLGSMWSGSLDGVPALIARTALVALAAGAIALVVLRLVRGGSLSISSVTAGPATVALSKDSTSFFDDYLDEIVYRFLACKWDVVMFEDIDRFENVEIFESLRSLNTLLNGAVKADPSRATREPIRFVYALRDSVFERLGRAAESETPDGEDPPILPDGKSHSDATLAELARANRTKFFDIVIPMVPFITYRNARELMKLELQDSGVSDGLIDLVAKHVAEMRLIKNSRNELEVFSEQLLNTTTPLPGLTADRIYALILYKSFHMTDFERIRTGQSTLDTLFSRGREVVSDSIIRLQDRRGALHESVTSGERARMLADRLRQVLATFRLTQVSGDIDSPEFWRNAPQLGYRERSGNTGTLNRDELSTVLEVDLDPSRWDQSSAETRDRELKQIADDLSTLGHATWADLFARPDFTTKGNESFASICASLDSQLAVDLVQHGFITEYFALDIAPVYGQMVDPQTYNYMIHFVDRGTSDLHYPLTSTGVEAILRDYGRDVLRDQSMQNLTVMDYLLAQSPEDARIMIEDLLGSEDSGQRFFTNYLESGTSKVEVVRLLTPRSPKIYSMLVDLAQHSDPAREPDTLLNTALALGSENVEYELPSRLRSWIETNYKTLPCFADASSTTSDANAAVAIAARTGVKFADVEPLSGASRDLAVKFRSYIVTAHNLAVLVESDDITLDFLAEDPEIFDYVVSELAEYLAATGASSGPVEVVKTLETLVQILNGLPDASTLDALLHRTQRDLVIEDLTTVPAPLWPTLVAARRASPSLSNVSTYRTEYGIDASLSSLLGWAREISDVSLDDQAAERSVVAQDLVRASAELPDAQLRVGLASSLSPGELDPSVVGNETGPIVGLMLAAGLLPDSAETFSQPNMRHWATFANALHRSTKFAEFMTPALVESGVVSLLLSDADVSAAVRQTVVDNLGAYVASADEQQLAAIVRAISVQGYPVPAEQLDYLAGRNVDAEALVQILPACRIDISAVLTLLGKLPAPYARLAEPLTDTVRLPEDPAHESLVQRLKAEGLARSRRAFGRIDVYPPSSSG